MNEKTYRFKIADKEYEVGKMKGKQARLYMLRIASLLAELVDAARLAGIDLMELIGVDFTTALRNDPSFIIDQLVKLLLAVGKLSSGDFFFRFEALLPVILGVDEETLNTEGELLEVYSAAVGVLIFQVGLNFTPEAVETMENFQTPTPSQQEQAQVEGVVNEEKTSTKPEPQEILSQ
jgi:hypothetical protein